MSETDLLIRALAALLAKHVQTSIDNGAFCPAETPDEAMAIHSALAHACDVLGAVYDPGITVLIDNTFLYEDMDLSTLATQLDPGHGPLRDFRTQHVATNAKRACLSIALAAIHRQWQPFFAQSLSEYTTTRNVAEIQTALNLRLHGVWSSDPRVSRANRLLKPFGLRFAGFTVHHDDDDAFVSATVRTKPVVAKTP